MGTEERCAAGKMFRSDGEGRGGMLSAEGSDSREAMCCSWLGRWGVGRLSFFRVEADVPFPISDSEVTAASRGRSLADCVSLASFRLCLPCI